MAENSIVERWEMKGDLLAAEAVSLRWEYRLSQQAALGILVLLPFFFGGTNSFGLFAAQSIIFLLGALFAVRCCGASGLTGELSRPRAARLLLLVLLAFVLLGALQAAALPSWLLELVSPNTSRLYKLAGAGYLHLSIVPAETVQEVLWLGALGLAAFWLLSLPVDSTRLSLRRRTRPARAGDDPARCVDRLTELLQRGFVAAGTAVSITAIVHWAFKAEHLFGIFEAQFGPVPPARAHWPFVNPDHLSNFLLAPIMAAFSRILVLGRLPSDRRTASRPENLPLLILQSPSRLAWRLPYAIAFFTMVLGNLIAASRAGNALMFAGLFILWITAIYHPLPRLSETGQPGSGRLWLHRAGRAAALLVFLTAILMFIGQTGRDLAANRVEYGLAAGYDQSRQTLARVSLSIFRDNPVLGVGLGGWGQAAAAYVPRELAGWTLDYAHNDYLQLLAECGAAGGLMALCAAAILLLSGLPLWRVPLAPAQRLFFCGCLLGALLPLLHALVDFPFHIPGNAYMITLALVAYVRATSAIGGKLDGTSAVMPPVQQLK